jgi:hypothetical protein
MLYGVDVNVNIYFFSIDNGGTNLLIIKNLRTKKTKLVNL